MAGPLWKALAMLGWGIVVISMIDQFLRPWLIGQEVQIPALFFVFSVLAGWYSKASSGTLWGRFW
jgi:predicted PurR-regulated permease PerM